MGNEKIKNLENKLKTLWKHREKRFGVGDLKFLYEKAQNKKVIVEMGVSQGFSTLTILVALEHAGGHLWSIDYNRKACKEAVKTVKEWGLEKNWTFIVEDVIAYSRSWKKDKMIDFIYIDLSANFKREWWGDLFKAWVPYLKQNGEILIHAAKAHFKKGVGFVKGPNFEIRNIRFDRWDNCLITKTGPSSAKEFSDVIPGVS